MKERYIEHTLLPLSLSYEDSICLVMFPQLVLPICHVRLDRLSRRNRRLSCEVEMRLWNYCQYIEQPATSHRAAES